MAVVLYGGFLSFSVFNLSFFLSWVVNTQINHLSPKRLSCTVAHLLMVVDTLVACEDNFVGSRPAYRPAPPLHPPPGVEKLYTLILDNHKRAHSLHPRANQLQ